MTDRLDSMRCFVAVAEASSFRAAARHLGGSESSVSRYVAVLERRIGVSLVYRTARSVTFTEAGRGYLRFAERVLREIDDEDAALASSHGAPVGTLAVLCPEWVGTQAVGSAVAAFARRHPRIRLSFEVGRVSAGSCDFLGRGFDVAFHTRDLEDSSVRIRRLADLSYALVASSEYVGAAGMPSRITELPGHRCLIHSKGGVWELDDGGGR